MPTVDIDTDYIEKIAELLQRTGLTEIEICQGDARIRVVKQLPPVEYVHAAPASMMAAAAMAPSAGMAATSAESAPQPEASHPGTVTSPMVGTVYLSPEPSAAPFVKVGDVVREGQTLLIIEAMKVMNSIRATRAGRVSRIFVSNAAPVEYGEPLLIIE